MPLPKIRVGPLALTLFFFLGCGVLGRPAVGAAQQLVVTVRLADIQFHPERIKVQKGQVVEFVNDDPFDHDVYVVYAADENRIFFPRHLLHPGEKVRVKVDESALLNVYCTIHGGMSAKLTTTGSFELTPAEKARIAARPGTLPPIVREGEELFWSKAQCHQCHRIGERGTGLRGPNLAKIGFRAAARAEQLGLDSGTEYMVESILYPSKYVVPGYSDDMPQAYYPPIQLTRDQIKAIVTYLQAQGGQVDEWAINLPESFPPFKAYNPYAKGDPERGRKVFFDKARCNSCHTVGSHRAISVGPDLTRIGAYRNWAWLIQAILEPNAEIGFNWKNATVYTRDGDIIGGILRQKTATELEMLLPGDRIVKIPLSKVERVDVEPGSRMPGNYDTLLTYQEMADLIAFLASLKGDASPPSVKSQTNKK